MASPIRADPGGPRRDPEIRKTSGAGPESPRSRRMVWYWFWGFWIVIFAAAIAWGVWGAAAGNGWWFLGHPNPSNVSGPPINGPGLAALQAPNKQPYVGQKFQANYVPVQKKISDTVFLVGPKNATPTLLVIKNSTASRGGVARPSTNIDAGTLIDITGTVEKSPPPAQAQNEWKLSSEEATQLARQGGYIQAAIAFYVPR